MNILLTNLYITTFGGTENWCYSMAKELIKQGHKVELYTPTINNFFKKFEELGVTFSNGGNYDLILDNHCMVNKIQTKGKIIHTCHGIIDAEKPLPNADLNVAVTEKVKKTWNLKYVIPNGIDLDRFKIINKPNDKLKKIISLCKSDTANDVLKQICNELNLDLEIMFGKEVFNIENKINEADLVVGIGRSILDGMACGRPVVSFDDRFYFKTRMCGNGYITPDVFYSYTNDDFAEQNKLLPDYTLKTFTKEELKTEILKYKSEDGIINRKFIIDNYSIQNTVKMYLELYKNL